MHECRPSGGSSDSDGPGRVDRSRPPSALPETRRVMRFEVNRTGPAQPRYSGGARSARAADRHGCRRMPSVSRAGGHGHANRAMTRPLRLPNSGGNGEESGMTAKTYEFRVEGQLSESGAGGVLRHAHRGGCPAGATSGATWWTSHTCWGSWPRSGLWVSSSSPRTGPRPARSAGPSDGTVSRTPGRHLRGRGRAAVAGARGPPARRPRCAVRGTGSVRADGAARRRRRRCPR